MWNSPNRSARGSRRSRHNPLAGIGLSWMLGVSCVVNAGDSAWESNYDKEGVKVETRAVEGSAIRAFRAETEVNASVDSLLAVLADPAACARWIHNCKRAEILDSTGFYQRNTYQVNDMPWPVVDRDLVLEVLIEEQDDGSFRMDMVNRPDSVPEESYVRIRQSQGFYLLKPVAEGRTRIEWEQHTDPGGALPAWLINQLLVDVPANTLRQLRDIATQTPYKDQQLQRDASGQILGWQSKDAGSPQMSAR